MSEIVSFGEWVIRRRKLLDLTRKALAQQVGCSPVTINKIERDERRPSVDMATLLAQHLQIPAAEQDAFVQRARGTYLAQFESPLGMEVSGSNAVTPEDTRPAERDIPHNLPPQPTPFIGREAELARLDDLLNDPQNRLITIIGAGGMGKTRLALAWAQQWLRVAPLGSSPAVADGLFFVNLAPLSDVEQIVPEIAELLNVSLSLQGGDGRSPRQQLLDYLHSKKILLLFDNFEHLLDGVDLLADILQTAPEVQLLVTSRERLHLRTEQLYPIQGLEFPDWETPEDAAEYTAVQLFLQSARRNQPDFELRDGDDLTYLARICRIVAGMPLALELAASWIDMLPLAEIAAELQQGLDILETEMRDVPERHRSIRAAIEHSWQKLAEKERDIFAKLSVFRGGFTREAAQAVAGATLRHLSRLASKSLLQGGQADGRYQIHELLRQYGAEKLVESGDETAVRHQYGDFFGQALQRWQKALNSSHFGAAVTEIEADFRNIEKAWAYALDNAHWENLLIAVNGLGDYFDANGRWFEGIRLLQLSGQQLQPEAHTPPLTVATARLLVWLAAWQTNLDINARGVHHPQDMYQRVLKPALDLLAQPLFEAVDCRAEEAFLRLQLGRILKEMDGRREEGQTHLATSLRLYREVGNLSGVSDALYETSFYHYGQLIFDRALAEKAQKVLQASLVLLQPLDDPRRLIRLYLRLSGVARDLGAFAEATATLENAYVTAQSAGHLIGMWDARQQSGLEALSRGQYDLALSYSRESLRLAEQAHSPVRIALSLSTIGAAQVYRGEFWLALDLFQESRQYQKEKFLNPESDIGYMNHEVQAYGHAGYYKKILSWAKTRQDNSWMFALIWVHLARAEYTAALSLTLKLFTPLPPYNHLRGQIRIPMAVALFGLGRQAEARQALYLSLQTCLEIQNFTRAIRLMPIIALVLADSDNLQQRAYAIELWAMAESRPFVSKSQLYADVVGQPMAAVMATMPADVVAAAQARGRALEWWPTAEALLTKLTEWGWNEVRVNS